MECVKTRNYCFQNIASKHNLKFKKDYAETFSEATSIKIQSQNWGGNRQWSTEGIAVNWFKLLLMMLTTKKNMDSIPI